MRIETLFTNGRIATMDRNHPTVEAIAVAGGRVVATGATAALLARRDRDTVVVDLGGRFACPAFVDPHNHFSMNVLAPLEVDCRTPPLTTIDQLLERIGAVAATLPAGAWLRGHGYDEEVLRERRHLTRADLDRAAPDHPVVLVHWSVHRCVLNSAALAALGIDRDTADPAGGWIVRSTDGLPTGVLYETASNPAQARSIAAYAERAAGQAAALLVHTAQSYLAAGITTVGDAYVSPVLAALYRAAGEAGALPLSVTGYAGSADGLFAPPAGDPARGLPVESWDQRSGIAGIKLFTDGGGNTTATTLLGDAAHRGAGRLFYRQGELDELVTAAHGHGLQVAIHAAGDMAVAMALTAMERARAAHPRRPPRLRVEHGVLLSVALIERLRAVGAVLVAQPVSVYYHAGRLAAAPLGEGLHQLPLRSLLDAGVPVAFSSDSPCYPLDPLLGVWAAVSRRTRAGGTASPEQRLTVAEALTAATAGAARALAREDEVGTLRPGLRADLVVLSADPSALPPDQLPAVQVEATYRAGLLAYSRRRDGAAPPIGRLPDAPPPR